MVDFQKGQTVTFAKSHQGHSAGGYHGSKTFRKGATAEVTAVRKAKITVRVENTNRASWESKFRSYNVDRDALEAPNGEVWSEADKPKVRKIGEVPADGIAPDDPRIAWIWEDAAKVARNSGHCWEYDNLVDKIGGIGRMRDITATFTVDGVKISATVKARSNKEAEQILRDKIAAAPTV